MEHTLKVHSFESFGTVDGPGIRYVIFLSGCHLRCKYCQNRDTWDIRSGHIMEVDELVSTISRYENYIKPSGGVTISGGEPLLQAPRPYISFQKVERNEDSHSYRYFSECLN